MVGRDTAVDAVYCEAWFLNSLLGESAGYTFVFGLGWAFVLKGLDWMYGQEETEDQNDN